MIITITFFRTSLPQELLEAAQLDGCSDIQYLLRIVLPLSAPIIAVLCLFYAVGHWNQFFTALIFLANKDLFPLQLILRDILVANTIDLNLLEDAKTMAAKAGHARPAQVCADCRRVRARYWRFTRSCRNTLSRA